MNLGIFANNLSYVIFLLFLRAIEHSNIVGKSELDSHNIRIAKVEGKIKKVAKVYNEEIQVDKASNL